MYALSSGRLRAKPGEPSARLHIMEIFLPILLLIVGFAFLVYGADFFVDGCCAVARTLHIPPLIIGLTIVALGTSAPEAAVSITAALTGSDGLSAGNCVGSNIFNLFVVVGLCALFNPVPVGSKVLRRDFPFSLIVEGLVLLLLSDFLFGKTTNMLGHVAGFSLFGLYIVYLIVLIIDARRFKTMEPAEDEAKNMPLWKSFLIIVVGAAAVVFGGDLVVDEAVVIAKFFGMSDTLIGLSIVAIGTSLPELATSIVAAKKGELELALGNCIGSNIANFLFVLGLSSGISTVIVGPNVIVDTVILIAASLLVYIVCIAKKKLGRPEGIAMLLIYAAYTAFIFSRELIH